MKKLWVVATLCVAAANSLSASDEASKWAQAGWEDGIRAGTVRGYPDGTYRPQQEATRAEAFHFAREEAERAKTEAVAEAKAYTDEKTAPLSGAKSIENTSGASAPERRVRQMDPVVVLVFGLLLAGVVVCFIIHLNQQGGGQGQRALGTAQGMQAMVPPNAGEVAISATDPRGGTVALRYSGVREVPTPAAQPPAQPVAQPAPPAAPAQQGQAAQPPAGNP